MSFLDTNSPLVLLYRDIGTLPEVPRYDIMLSPQFYVVKREELPVKYPFQAKKLAPSVLGDIAEGERLTYEVFRDHDGQWVFVAYDLQKISDFLVSKGSSIDHIGKLYFAEQSKDLIHPPVSLGEHEVLAVVNDTATIVPKHLLADSQNLTFFDESFRPKSSFGVPHQHSNLWGSTDAIVVAILMAAIGMAYFAEGYRYHAAHQASMVQLGQVLDDAPSLRGAYARKAIYQKYTAIDKHQRAIRDKIKSISKLVSKKTKIDSITIDSKGYKAQIDISKDTKSTKSLRAIAEAEGLTHLKITSGKLTTQGVFK